MSHQDWVYINKYEGYRNTNPKRHEGRHEALTELINGSTFGVYNTFIVTGYLILNLLFVLTHNG